MMEVALAEAVPLLSRGTLAESRGHSDPGRGAHTASCDCPGHLSMALASSLDEEDSGRARVTSQGEGHTGVGSPQPSPRAPSLSCSDPGVGPIQPPPLEPSATLCHSEPTRPGSLGHPGLEGLGKCPRSCNMNRKWMPSSQEVNRTDLRSRRWNCADAASQQPDAPRKHTEPRGLTSKLVMSGRLAT